MRPNIVSAVCALLVVAGSSAASAQVYYSGPVVTYRPVSPAPVVSYYNPATTTTYYAPSTSYYAPSTSYYAPTTSYYAPTTSYYSPTTSYYAPTTSYYAPAAPTTSYYAPSVGYVPGYAPVRYGVFGLRRAYYPTYVPVYSGY